MAHDFSKVLITVSTESKTLGSSVSFRDVRVRLQEGRWEPGFPTEGKAHTLFGVPPPNRATASRHFLGIMAESLPRAGNKVSVAFGSVA